MESLEEQNKEKRMKRIEDSRRDLWDNIKCTNIRIAQGRGSRRAISRSKRRKVMATRKNFMEKGRRADPIDRKSVV